MVAGGVMQLRAQHGMHRLRLLRRRRPAGADGPDGLVGDDDLADAVAVGMDDSGQLTSDDRLGMARLALRLLQSCVREEGLARAALQYGAVEGMLAAAVQQQPINAQLLADVAQVLTTLVAQFKLDTVAWFAQRSSVHAQALALLAAQPGAGAVPAQLASRLAEVGPSWPWQCPVPYKNPALASALELGDASSSTAAAPGGAPIRLLDDRGQPITRKFDVFLSHRQIDSQDLIKALKIQLELDGYICFLGQCGMRGELAHGFWRGVGAGWSL